MHEAAFAEFHQVCHEVSQALLVLLRVAFSNCSGACCLKNARRAGKCGFNNLKLTLLYGKRSMTICQLSHTIVCNAFLNIIAI